MAVMYYITEQTHPSFLLQSSVQLWQSLHRCWDSDVYLPPLCHRFWKLTLQLVSRYATWIMELQDEVRQTCRVFGTVLLSRFLDCFDNVFCLPGRARGELLYNNSH